MYVGNSCIKDFNVKNAIHIITIVKEKKKYVASVRLPIV